VTGPSLPEQFRGFADAAERDGGTTYATICRSAADDPDLMALIAEAPLAQRRPNLLLAAVHFLLLRGVDDPLRHFYDTVDDERGGAAPVRPDQIAGAFRAFCLTHRRPLLDLITNRSTQTNEVGRCVALLPALCAIAARYGDAQPLSLFDLGTSAGLNLLFDHYAYAYRPHDGGAVLSGDAASGVTLDCALRGERADLPTLTFPGVAARVGLDLSPIDVASDDDALWLLACLWPDNRARFDRLRAALHLARSASCRPRLERGDMIDDLARVAATIDPATPLVVVHSWVAAYLSQERQRALAAAVQALGATRPVHHVYAEAPFETPGLPTPACPEPRPKAHLSTALVHIGPGGEPPARWADMHPHGSWIRWWATAPVPTGRPAGPEPAPRPR
jgi:hypothetical protein